MSASFLLITQLFLIADGSQAGMGGASTAMQVLDSKAQCEIAKNAFLNEMPVTHKEITGDTLKYLDTKVTRKAKCVNLNPVTVTTKVGNKTVTKHPDGSVTIKHHAPVASPKVKENN